jgi:predicted enzyme related to lactoylglutathione lyase
MPRIVHFEFLADDPERATKFWQDTFGWTAQSFGGQNYWLIDTGEGEPGINGGIMRRGDFPRPVNSICTVGVDDVDAALAQVKANGGDVVLEKFEVGGAGWSAYCTDSEGNVFGVFEAAQDAPS